MEKQENVKTISDASGLCSTSAESENIEGLIEELKAFIESFDPYSNISEKDRKYLLSLNIYDLDDPFKITNQLISRIEDLIERKENN